MPHDEEGATIKSNLCLRRAGRSAALRMRGGAGHEGRGPGRATAFTHWDCSACTSAASGSGSCCCRLAWSATSTCVSQGQPVRSAAPRPCCSAAHPRHSSVSVTHHDTLHSVARTCVTPCRLAAAPATGATFCPATSAVMGCPRACAAVKVLNVLDARPEASTLGSARSSVPTCARTRVACVAPARSEHLEDRRRRVATMNTRALSPLRWARGPQIAHLPRRAPAALAAPHRRAAATPARMAAWRTAPMRMLASALPPSFACTSVCAVRRSGRATASWPPMPPQRWCKTGSVRSSGEQP